MANQSEVNSVGARYLSDSTNTNISNTSDNALDITALQLLLEEISIPGTMSNGDGTSASITILASRYSRIVTMTIPEFSATITASNGPFYELSVNVDVSFRPSTNVWGSASVINLGANEQGHVLVRSDGILRVYRNANHTTNYSTGATTGASGIGFSYALL